MFLTKEESQIASLVAEGCTNAEIGDLIGYTPDAIKKNYQEYIKFLKQKIAKLLSQFIVNTNIWDI